MKKVEDLVNEPLGPESWGVMPDTNADAVKEALIDLRAAMGFLNDGEMEGYVSPTILLGAANVHPELFSGEIIVALRRIVFTGDRP